MTLEQFQQHWGQPGALNRVATAATPPQLTVLWTVITPRPSQWGLGCEGGGRGLLGVSWGIGWGGWPGRGGLGGLVVPGADLVSRHRWWDI